MGGGTALLSLLWVVWFKFYWIWVDTSTPTSTLFVDSN